MNTIYFHSKSSPRTTVAAVIEGQSVSFGVSRCGRKDQFVKKTGRKIAEGRARKNPYKISILPSENLSQWLNLNAQEIAREIQENPQLIHS